MRKRKLYVSELLKRNTNKNLSICIKSQFTYSYFDSVESCIRQKDFLDYQVVKWNIDLIRNQINITIWGNE